MPRASVGSHCPVRSIRTPETGQTPNRSYVVSDWQNAYIDPTAGHRVGSPRACRLHPQGARSQKEHPFQLFGVPENPVKPMPPARDSARVLLVSGPECERGGARARHGRATGMVGFAEQGHARVHRAPIVRQTAARQERQASSASTAYPSLRGAIVCEDSTNLVREQQQPLARRRTTASATGPRHCEPAEIRHGDGPRLGSSSQPSAVRQGSPFPRR